MSVCLVLTIEVYGHRDCFKQTDGATSNKVNLLSHDVIGILTCLVLRQQQQKLNQRMLINFIRGSITVRLTYCFSSLVLFDNFRSFQATFLH